MVIPEVHLVMRSGEKLLLLRRYQTGYMDGLYSVVAGHVDGNETFRVAVAREAHEEAGISLNPEGVRLVHTMHRRAKDERLSLFFEADTWDGEIKNMEPHKCDDLGWYSVGAQSNGIVPYVHKALRLIANGIPYSEFGWN